MAQFNPVVGDIASNSARVSSIYADALARGCDVLAFTELVLTGYPPEDLVLKSGFVTDNIAALHSFAATTSSCVAVVGFVDRVGDELFNAAAVCAHGRESPIQVPHTSVQCHSLVQQRCPSIQLLAAQQPAIIP